MSKLRNLVMEEGRSSVFPTMESMYQVGTRAITGCYHVYENCYQNGFSTEYLRKLKFCAKEVDKIFQMPINFI